MRPRQPGGEAYEKFTILTLAESFREWYKSRGAALDVVSAPHIHGPLIFPTENPPTWRVFWFPGRGARPANGAPGGDGRLGRRSLPVKQ